MYKNRKYASEPQLIPIEIKLSNKQAQCISPIESGFQEQNEISIRSIVLLKLFRM